MNWTLIATETFSATARLVQVVERNMKSVRPVHWSFFYIFTIIREGEAWTLLLNQYEINLNVNLCPKAGNILHEFPFLKDIFAVVHLY